MCGAIPGAVCFAVQWRAGRGRAATCCPCCSATTRTAPTCRPGAGASCSASCPPRAPSRETFDQHATAWLRTQTTGTRPTTYANYALNVRRLSLHLGHRALTEIDEDAIEAAYAALLTRGLKGHPLSRRSVEQAH